MGIKTVQKVNVVDQVFEQMKENIINGEWAPGSKIPSENELCEQFAVSRNTVRSSIQKLKTLGILDTRQGQGTFVCKMVNDNFIEAFIPITYLGREQIIEILEFRKIVEMESVRLASLYADEHDLNRIRDALEEMKRFKDDYKRYSLADYQYHLAIAKASKNSVFYRVMLKLQDIIYSHFEEMNRDLGTEMSIENHHKIFEAVMNRDPGLAQSLLRDTLDLSINSLKDG